MGRGGEMFIIVKIWVVIVILEDERESWLWCRMFGSFFSRDRKIG